MDIIKAIELPASFDQYTNRNDRPLSYLEPTSHINILVGSNNSGKSWFMRLLSAQNEYQTQLRKVNLIEINQKLNAIFDDLKNALETSQLTEALYFNEKSINQLKPLPTSLSLNEDSFKEIRNTFTNWSGFPEIIRWTQRAGAHITEELRKNLRNTIRYRSTEALQILERVPIYSEVNLPKRVYIPVLRGLRPIDEQHSDLYAARTLSDYFSDNEQNPPDIFTGLTFYKRLTGMLLGNNSQRKIISDYQDFVSKTLFENKPIALIPSPDIKAVVVKIGNEKEQPIYHLGDGIQSAIILSFLPYVMKESTFFFIEEPEMYFHPGLQRKILNFFDSLSRHMFFLTTHSNHFLDLTIDIKNVSVFTFRKNFPNNVEYDDEQTPTFSIEAIDRTNTSSLELLGVRNSSVFLVNATIWVEGITDRWYLREMLKAYMDDLSERGSLVQRLEEDVHYSFVEYGGANITHWSFLDYEEHPIEVKRLCARALVVVDKDGDTKLKRKEELTRILGDRLIILPGREIENLLPYNVIKQVILEYERTPDRQLPKIQYSSYQNGYLGTFIESRILRGEFSRKGGYKSESGSVKSKVDFCKKSLPKIKYSDLPPSTQQVIEKIYKFILSQNK